MGKAAFDNFVIYFLGIALSLGIRWSLSEFETEDFRAFSSWLNFINTHGGAKALKYSFADYSPPYLYLLLIGTWLPISKTLVIKGIPILFDYVAAACALMIVRLKYPVGLQPQAAFFAVLFLPTVLMNGALWGQCDSAYTAGLLAALYAILKERNLLAILCYSLALSFKLQAIFFLPLILALTISRRIPASFLLIIPWVYIILISPCLFAGRSLPDLLSIYLQQAQEYESLSLGAANVYQWLPTTDFLDFPFISTAGILLAVSAVYFLLALFYRAGTCKFQNENILLMTLTLLLVCPFLLPRMHERYFFAADIVSIICVFYMPRLFWMALGIQAASFFTYLPYLFNTEPIKLSHLAILIAIVLATLTAIVVRQLFPGQDSIQK